VNTPCKVMDDGVISIAVRCHRILIVARPSNSLPNSQAWSRAVYRVGSRPWLDGRHSMEPVSEQFRWLVPTPQGS
jgi:hypothetical protein